MTQVLQDPLSQLDREQFPSEGAANPASFHCITRSQGTHLKARDVAEEVPIAIELNGFGYAVLMASPIDLEDLLFGFLSSERVIEAKEDIVSFDVCHLDAGVIVRATVASSAAQRLTDRVRHRTSDSSCGLCGIENLEQVMRELPPIPSVTRANDRAIFSALEDLREHQPLNRATGAVHAAALCDAQGAIRTVREDVGRHNAFDKLIGAMVREQLRWNEGFALLSSRCSYELVEKAVVSGCPMLVTISAPTSLALSRAAHAGLDLRVLARSDSILSPAGED